MRYQSLTIRIITCKTSSKRLTVDLFSKWMLSLDLFTEIYSHISGSDQLIYGARAQAHIDHNKACIHGFICRCDISIKMKLGVLLIEDGLGSSNIKA